MPGRRFVTLAVLLAACGPDTPVAPAAGNTLPEVSNAPAQETCPSLVFDPGPGAWRRVSGEPGRWTRGAVIDTGLEGGTTLDEHPELRDQEFLHLEEGCGPFPIARRMRRAETGLARYAAAPFGPTRPDMAERFPVQVEKTVDERTPDRGLLVHRVTHPEGTPPGWVRDEVRCVCFRSLGARHARLHLTGPVHNEASLVEETRRLCAALEVE